MNTSQEWLETDGLGGFASGTTNGIRTRRYHALLLTATTPPTGRVALVNGFEAWIETPRGKFALTSQRYAPDVVQAMIHILMTGQGKGQVYNISQDETVTLPEFVEMVSDIMGKPTPELVEIKRSLLEANGFLPDCSPFSDRWMSELDNTLSKSELGINYTPLRTYLEKIVAYYNDNPLPTPAGYKRRRAELLLHSQLVEGLQSPQ